MSADERQGVTYGERVRLLEALGDASAVGSRALSKWGCETQRQKAVEECSELAAAVARDAAGSATHDTEAEVIGEVADVLIMAMQMAELYGVDATIDALRAKATRLEGRLK